MKLRHQIVVVGVEPFAHLAGGRWLAAGCPSAGDAKQGVQIHGAILVTVAGWDITQQQGGAQHLIVPGEIAHRQQIDTGLLLPLPVACPQLAPCGLQLFLAQVASPVGFEGAFEFTLYTDAREAEGVGLNGHIFLRLDV